MNNNALSFTVHIVFDNKCAEKGFLTGFGFSALIYNHLTQNYSLFDTGGNAEVLINNIKKFNVDVKEIKKVIISHNHYDHSGGLDGIYRKNVNVKIYIPEINVKSYKMKFSNSQIISVSDFIEIEKNVYSSGQFGTMLKEQALFLKTKNNKIVIIVGCTHPGLENFILKAREISNIKAIIGGFHGFRKYSFLEGIDFIGACHCTTHIDAIRQRFPEQYKKVCVGNSFSF